MSINLMYVLKYANQAAEAEEKQHKQIKAKYGREPKLIYPRLKKIVKPNQTVKLTISIPKFNDYDYSVFDNYVWLDLQKTKIRKVIKPDGSHHFIIAPKVKKGNLPILKINNEGDVFIHQKNRIKKYSHKKLPLFYEDVVNSVKKLNKALFPLTQKEKEAIKNGKLLNRIIRFVGKLFKK